MLIICSSEADAVEVLTRDSRIMEGKGFRTFRWMPGFSVKREPTTMVSWVRLHGLDPCLYRPGFLKEICRGFGVFLKADSATLDLSNPAMARVCVEIDLRCSLVPGVWVGTAQQQQWVDIEYEGNIEYCYRCKKQGHSVDKCKKELAKSKRQNLKREQSITEKSRSNAPVETPLATTSILASPKNNLSHQQMESEARQWQFPKRQKIKVNQSKNQPTWKVRNNAIVAHHGPNLRDIEEGFESIVEDSPKHVPKSDAQSEGIQDLRLTPAQSESDMSLMTYTSDRDHRFQNVSVAPCFMQRLKDNIEDYIFEVFEQRRPNLHPTTYMRRLSVDDSDLDNHSPASLAVVDKQFIAPLSIVSAAPVVHDQPNHAELIEGLERSRNQLRRVTRSASKLLFHKNNSC
uniref:CCHC-type domain-containing protein n=1 Tax=Kalanchoe fedtschenkoi TaxID=63787 RepID=A0A7N0VEE7_KALFE